MPLSFNAEDRDFSDEDLLEMFGQEIQYGKELCFLLDESASRRIVLGLQKNLGIGVTLLEDIGMKGESSDFRVLRAAADRGCILIAANGHFGNIHSRLQSIPDTFHPGILWIKSEAYRSDPAKVNEVIQSLFEKYYAQPNVIENSIRVL